MDNRSGRGPSENRNILIAVALSAAILFGFEFFYNAPQRARLQAEEQARIEATQPAQESGSAEAPPPSGPVAREQVLAQSAGARIVIDTPEVDGSIALEGARIDDLNLRDYRRTIDPGSGEVTVLAPRAAEFAHDAFFGWEMRNGENTATLADAFSGWSATEGARLTPETPVTLTLAAGEGLTIERTISIDQNYMFTITDVVRNSSGAPISARPFGTVRRMGLPQDYVRNQIVHQGLIGAFGENNNLRQVTYENANKHIRDRARGRVGAEERIEEMQGQGGWFGITDHYWLAAIVPAQSERVSTYFDARSEGAVNDYRAAYRGDWREIAAGGEVTYTQHLFAGAKRYEVLRDYQNTMSIPRFDDAIDWGNFWFLTRPFFQWLLHPLAQIFADWGVVFNFGLAILASTIVIKLLLFPLVYQSFKSMAKMRALAPKMKEVQERYAADKQRQQQEILKLYQTEKINPVAGCVPILLQIPVFFALYKTLSVTIEMRHAPFVGWIHDLSARDPTSIFNLFGLLPFDVPAFLLIGAWPILYGVSMWALQALSPPPTDPVQAQIFRFLPLLFTVMFAAFPAGLVIYWTWSNTLSILQQYVIMRRQGVETQLDTFLAKRFGKTAKAAE
ncbi:membrane protein insertase YidC [Vitreimonas sp.]|uniref:membrane protein insertase YidC n=1 Tax=Vitreimonas sp. TaxID=3069702 RepID=UPI002ED9BE08